MTQKYLFYIFNLTCSLFLLFCIIKNHINFLSYILLFKLYTTKLVFSYIFINNKYCRYNQNISTYKLDQFIINII